MQRNKLGSILRPNLCKVMDIEIEGSDLLLQRLSDLQQGIGRHCDNVKLAPSQMNSDDQTLWTWEQPLALNSKGPNPMSVPGHQESIRLQHDDQLLGPPIPSSEDRFRI